MAFSAEKLTVEDTNLDAEAHNAPPIRYLSLDDVYSASGSSILMSKKIKARKLPLAVESFLDDQKSMDGGGIIDPSGIQRRERVPLAYVYSRRSKRQRIDAPQELSFFDQLVARENLACQQLVKVEVCDDFGGDGGSKENGSKAEQLSIKKKKKKNSGGELMKLGVDSSTTRSLDRLRLRETRGRNVNGRGEFGRTKRKKVDSATLMRGDKVMPTKKRWVRLSYDDVDPKNFIGLQCKVFWPLDHEWYSGSVVGYDPETNNHHVCYEDEDKEDLILANEKIKFFVSPGEMQNLKLRYGIKTKIADSEVQDFDEMVALAAGLEDFQDFQTRDIVWAKLAGHPVWPGVIVDDSNIANLGAANINISGNAVTVQFFGTHDFARIKTKQVIPFFQGVLSSFHLKCKKPEFIKGLEEAKKYLSEHAIPKEMLEKQNQPSNDDGGRASDEDRESGESAEDCNVTGINYPYSIGDLQIISLGRIVKDSRYFQDGKFICPKGYTAVRKFTSISDPKACSLYKMEVLADVKSKGRPLFRVSVDNEDQQFTGSTPSACWDKIYAKLDDGHGGDGGSRTSKSGSYMFGFSIPEVIKLIKRLSKSKCWPTSSKCNSSLSQDIPVGYQAIHMSWKHLDKCSVCHMDEEYANNLFLQCDKCRMMVHARCYGVVEPVDGDLWWCQLCRVGAPSPPPRCCLCPLTGGAMKPTTDGRWAHLSCAMWIPETCLSDVKRMEPIDGINRIHKDRWKLECSICRVPYGACIQCSNNNCRVAYHPLCARAADLCVELEDEDKLHLLSLDDDEENQCIRLLSFCKRHKQPSNDRPGSDAAPIGQVISRCCDYTPPLNPSGCARTEPYNYFGRRGRKEPEALAAASLKRLFVENQPYLVTGYNQHELFGNLSASTKVNISKYSTQDDGSNNISSMSEKYKYMRDTFRKRLAFGKSGIHGFGIFTKQPHRAGDMVIEYTGELVRPSIADRREHFIYNSLVGAGTYMFRIDDERVIDATRAGSIAHLINHSCEPNCYSRVISVNGDEHIIIFAKRDIKRWEELTYDYRFFSIDERLACYCGFPECRGVVNDTEAEEQASKLRVPRRELTDWRGE